MFNGVRGEGIKNFFKGRSGRKLSFASQEPVKIQTGADIVEIAKGAVDNNHDNLVIASLKATVEDLKMQLAVKKDAKLQSKLEWAIEYLAKFEAEVEKLRKKPAPKPTPQPGKKPDPKKLEHELKTIFNNIKIQSERVMKSLTRLPFALVKDDFEEIKVEIETINEQVSLYEQSVKAYVEKGGTEEYPKIVFARLKVIYKLVAKKIEEFKDELKESSEEKYEIKQNIALLEKFADDLVKFAESPEVYAELRTEVDMEIAEEAKKKNPKPTPEPPLKPSYQDVVDSYEVELNKLNTIIVELNKAIARVEELIKDSELTTETIAEFILLEEQIKKCTLQIDSSKVTLASLKREAKNTHKLDIDKLPAIQEIKVEKIQYKLGYSIYIETLDRKAIEAIGKIKELELSKTNAKKEEIPAINQEIVVLYKFLLAISSLVDKRIVQYSKANRKNITELYKNRLARRKEIAAEYEVKPLEPITVVPEGKSEIDVFKERIDELATKWLKAIRTAPIDRKGIILLDEKAFAEEMSILIAHSHDEAMLKIVMEASEKFNKERGLQIREKRAVLNKFREKVMTRIALIFQSGTISENVVDGVDYNEWLTEIEYSELILLTTYPEYKELVPNGEDLIKEYIADQEKKYRVIKKRQQSTIIENLSIDFAELISKTEPIAIDENFEDAITAIFVAMKTKYKVLKDFDYKLDFVHNVVTVNYNATQYEFSSGSYKIVPQQFEHVIMSQNKYKAYQASKNINPDGPLVDPPVEPKKKTDENPSAEIKFDENTPENIKVTNRTLKLATRRRQVIDRAKNLIIKNADSLTVSLIKQGLKIRYNENLRNQLKALNAKLSLVNKSNYRSRKDIKFQGEETEQELAFKTPKENFNIEDYKLEVRLVDDEKKRSDLLYSFDLESISNELHGRTK